jgi:phosphonate transport system substrate-binding protein
MLLLPMTVSNAQVSSAPPVTLSVGIVPQQTATRTMRLWSELIGEVARRSGYQLEIKPAHDIPAFEQHLSAGEYDLAYMNPYEYTVYHRAAGYQAFVREEGQLQALIVVRRDSPMQKLSDLQGRTFAVVPGAFGATMIPLAHLHRKGIAVKPRFVDSHEAAYLAVIRGEYPAGGGVRRTFEQMVPEMRSELRVLWAAQPVTPHAFAVHPRVPRAVVERLQRVLVDLKRDAAGQRLLQAHGFTGIVEASDKEWDDVRALHIEALDEVLRQARP